MIKLFKLSLYFCILCEELLDFNRTFPYSFQKSEIQTFLNPFQKITLLEKYHYPNLLTLYHDKLNQNRESNSFFYKHLLFISTKNHLGLYQLGYGLLHGREQKNLITIYKNITFRNLIQS